MNHIYFQLCLSSALSVKSIMFSVKPLVSTPTLPTFTWNQSILRALGRWSLSPHSFFYHFLTFSIALYGLLVFYGLTAEELKGRRPLAKFLAIKLIVMFTFYQSFVASTCIIHFLASLAIQFSSFMPWKTGLFMACPQPNLSACANLLLAATQYWTVTNIANGLNALAICIEVRSSDMYCHLAHARSRWCFSPCS
jgi:Organic solute transporter Ostalpha